VPLEIMRLCCRAIELEKDFADKGSALAVSDAGVGVLFCKSALLGASLNVFINTKAMLDRAYAEEINAHTHQMMNEYLPVADAVYQSVLTKIV
jgi:formiminotetrahydrofolate cyclodeaminase